MTDREQFEAAITDTPLDHLRRCVFADWLDERGDVEEAIRQRDWLAAYGYLHDNLAGYEHNYEEGYRPGYAEVMADLTYFYDSFVANGGITFGNDSTPEELCDQAAREAFFRNLEIVVGKPITAETRANAGFRCAC